MQAREELAQLIAEATDLLSTQGAYFTEGSKAALQDVLEHAKAVYGGTYQMPFVRNREFAAPRQEEEICFALEHNTMTPGYHMTRYGLKPVLTWFRQQHVMQGDVEQKAADASRTAKTFLQEISLGSDVGEYSAQKAEWVTNALKELSGKHGDALGQAVVRLMDALRQLRHTRVMRSSREPKSNLFFSEAGFTAWQRRVQEDDSLRGAWEHIEGLAARYTQEQIALLDGFLHEPIDYERLNREFFIWSSSDSIINFAVPPEAVSARVMFLLPACENEADGLGHVWIDDVKLFAADGGVWNLENPGFEDGGRLPEHWLPVVQSGRPILRAEHTRPYCGREHGAAYIANPTAADCGGWINDSDIPVKGKTTHTITFMAKLDGKLKKGLQVMVLFQDENGNDAGRFEAMFNRKSVLTAEDFQMTAQADAIVYAVTNNLDYARKAAAEWLFILNDFCQGAEYWMVAGERPQGSDAYGAVQGGRLLAAFASSYMLIRHVPVWQEKEKQTLLARLAYIVRYLMDLRDRTELTDEAVQADATNWQTSMASGVGLLMLAMPDFPDAAQWLENAEKLLSAQLSCTVNADGSWPECIRYHHAALDWFAEFFKAFDHCANTNRFSRLAKMFRFSVMMQTPPYALYQGRISTPSFGDHNLSPGHGLYLHGLYCRDASQADSSLGSLMYDTWRKAGSPVLSDRKPYNVLLYNLLFPYGGYDSVQQSPTLVSTNEFPDAGIYLFRKNYGQEKEGYCAVMASPRPIGHGHYDQGSFLIYHNNVPVIADPAIEGYFDSTRDWYLSSSAHATLQFESKYGKQPARTIDAAHFMETQYSAQHGWTDTPRESEVLSFNASAEMDEIILRIRNSEGDGMHTRTIRFFRKEDIYEIHDAVEGFEGRIRVSLPVAAVDFAVDGNSVSCKGHFGVAVSIEFIGADDLAVQTQWRRCISICPPVGGAQRLLYVRAETGQREIITRLKLLP